MDTRLLQESKGNKMPLPRDPLWNDRHLGDDQFEDGHADRDPLWNDRHLGDDQFEDEHADRDPLWNDRQLEALQ